MDKYFLIVIGAGSGGLVVAIGAAKAGKKVLLIEKGTYGGDCTNFGCIPSKSLIASAEVAHMFSMAKNFGLEGNFSLKNTEGVFDRVRKIVDSIRSNEEPRILKEKGVDTLTGVASFINPHRIHVREDDGTIHEVEGNQIVIATGSSPLIPFAEGLSTTPYLTNETIFKLNEVPRHLCVMGGGPIGCELAQAFSRLGSKVTLIHTHSALLNREEIEAQQLVAETLSQERVELLLESKVKSVKFLNNAYRLEIESKEKSLEVVTDALLVAIGKKPNIELLNLELADIQFSEKGIPVDQYGRTSQKHIWAIGDVVEDGPRFTHAAENQGRKVLFSILSRIKKKQNDQSMPRVTFTDPEVASFGLLEKEARERYGNSVAVYFVPLSENDRAITADRTDGFVKVITKKISGKILGATIVGPRAGEMITELSLAAKEKIPLRSIGSLIHPYPTYNLAIRKAADLWLTQTIIPLIRKFFR